MFKYSTFFSIILLLNTPSFVKGEEQNTTEIITIDTTQNTDNAVVKNIATEIPETEMVQFSEEIATSSQPSYGISQAQKFFLTGEGFFSEGKFEEAFEAYRKSMLEDPDNAFLNYQMGRAAYEMSEYEEALFAFKRALNINPNMHLIRLETGRTLLALGNKNKAKEEFETVLGNKIPLDVRANVETLLAKISPAREHSLTKILFLSHAWDSNTTLGSGAAIPSPLDPSNPSIVSDPSLRSDRITAAALLLSHKFPLEHKGYRWKNDITIYYSDNAVVHANDLRLFTYGTGIIKAFNTAHELSSEASWTTLTIAEHLYQNYITLALKYTYIRSPRLKLNLGGTYQRRHHFSTTGVNKTFGLLNQYDIDINFVKNRKNTWNATYIHRFDKSPRDNNVAQVYNKHEISLRYTRRFDTEWSLKINGKRKIDKYKYAHATYPDRRRRDYGLIGEAILSYSYAPKNSYIDLMIFDLKGSYNDNNSNIPNNVYESGVGAISCTMIF